MKLLNTGVDGMQRYVPLRRGSMRSLLYALLLGSLCASCARFTPPDRSGAAMAIPERYSLYGPVESVAEQWWTSFSSPELNDLVDEALADNLTIEQAAARVRQAGALVAQSRAALRPQLGYTGDASISRRRTELGGGEGSLDRATRRLSALNSLLGAAGSVGGGSVLSATQSVRQGRDAVETLLAPSPDTSLTVDTDSYGLGLTAGYEVDLWGRLRSGEASAIANAEAVQEDIHAVMLSIAGQVVLTWLDTLEVAQVLDVVRGQLKTNETNLGLIELRYRNGLATTLDLYQQRQAVAETQSVIPPLEARQALLRHTLAVLLGKSPQTELGLEQREFSPVGPLPEYGIPMDLLARRPDIRAAGLRLRAADWEVSAARADRLPRLQLTAGLSSDVASLGQIFDSWLAQLAASVTGPIFDGGRRSAEVERTRAVVDEQLAAYRLTVLNALAEVEDALVLIDRQQAFITALEGQLHAAENAHREALGRYRKGLTDYLPVLTALRNLQGLERDVVEAEHDNLAYRVQLHLALGGNWMASHFEVSEGMNS